MADEWKAGDLALCVTVADARTPTGGNGVAGQRFRKGAIYTVSRVGSCEFGPVLWLKEDRSGYSAGAFRFRKIHPHAPDAEDEETIWLLKAAPEPAEV